MSRPIPRSHRIVGILGVVALTVGLAACGGSSKAKSAGGSASSADTASKLPATIKILSIRELTGSNSFAGINANKGIDLAQDEIQKQKYLGNTTLQLDTKDSAVSVQQAASYTSEAVADPTYSAIFGPASSAQSVAMSPLVTKGKIPTVYVQSGSDAIVTSDYTFRVTAPASSYFELAGQYLKSKNSKTAAVVYANNNPTLVGLATKSVPDLTSKYGFTVKSTDATPGTTTDFTALASKITDQKPDAVFSLVNGAQDPVFIAQLRQDGYTGEIVGMSSMGAGNLKAAGEKAKGVVWPTDFTADLPTKSSQDFVTAYKAKYSGEVPNLFAAEAYDAMWFLARGIKQANSADRDAIQKGLAAVAVKGWDGAVGALKFDGNDLRVSGVMAGWDGSKEIAVKIAS
ncbi:MAG: hypothetical protein JWM76_2651 [Pseudonocardiales bacterium]|nr:hypothetical protein [Pseudonocardiales bacterium]